MKKFLQFVLLGAVVLVLTAWGGTRFEGDWRFTTGNGYTGTMTFDEVNETVIIKSSITETSYDYKFSDDNTKLTVTKPDGSDKQEFEVKIIDDDNMTLKEGSEETKLNRQ